jgi:glycosyltransferase involved in cell wall biosynthesis
MNCLWITWENQQRNRSMADALKAPCHEIIHVGGRLRRYYLSIRDTWRVIQGSKPDVVFFQNPSLMLGLALVLIRRITNSRYRLVGDYHNAGVFPKFGGPVTRFLARACTLVIVSNENLGREVRSWGAKAFALPDPLPKLRAPYVSERPLTDPMTVLFICSWAEDEPVESVLEACNELVAAGHSVKVRVTGHAKVSLGPETLPSNVELTGYLTHDEFVAAIANCDLVMDLTTRDDCMVCGAYEGLTLGKPLLLTANEPTMEWFDKGAVFTTNSAEDIAGALVSAKEALGRLTQEAVIHRTTVNARFKSRLTTLLRTLNGT